MAEIILLLGGNLGDVKEIFLLTLNELQKEGFVLINKSLVYKSTAWGFESNNVFYNQALILETNLNAQLVLDKILSIEERLGRTRSDNLNYIDRTIDIDIIFIDDTIINNKNLSIPHPRMQERNFCLVPLLELVPNFIHPILKLSIKELAKLSCDKIEVTSL